jgi:hypothetical protein
MEITKAEWRVKGIHAHIGAALARPFQGGPDGPARCRLGGNGDRILQIQNGSIGADLKDLFRPARMITRGEKETAIGTGGVHWRLSFI